jgi:Tfp pilus assembly protein PilZ
VKASDRYVVDGVSCALNGRLLPVVNLSVGGFFVVTDQPPIEGQVVALQLQLGDRPPVAVLGRVSWVNGRHGQLARNLPAGFGVKITQIDLAGKLALVEQLKRSRAAGRHRPA